jgi:hypothetical protein
VISRILWKFIVGASLLANAIDHSMNVSTDMPLSRAGSLPQGSVVVLEDLSVVEGADFCRDFRQ